MTVAPRERERRVLDLDGMTDLLLQAGHFPGIDRNKARRRVKNACMSRRIPAWKHPITGKLTIYEDELLSVFRVCQNEAAKHAAA